MNFKYIWMLFGEEDGMEVQKIPKITVEELLNLVDSWSFRMPPLYKQAVFRTV